MLHIPIRINNLPLILNCLADGSIAITKTFQDIRVIVDNKAKDFVSAIMDNVGMTFDNVEEDVVEYSYGTIIRLSDFPIIRKWLKQENMQMPRIGHF